MCPYHAERKPITSRVKSVQQPMEAPTLLSLIEIDLMDFCKCPCDCKESHTWVMNVTDHHTKHVALYCLTAKSGEKVLDALQQHCHTYGYPKKIVCDNGKEFCNKHMEMFCKNNGITMKHGAPRTSTTRWLIERSNRSCKEDMHTLIVSTAEKDSNWCRKLGEISYTRNISYHTAIQTTPYEAVYGMKPHREVLQQSIQITSEDRNHNLVQNPRKRSLEVHVEENDQAPTEERKEKGQKFLKTKQDIMRKWSSKVKRKLTKNLVSLKLEM